jgi:hypothetical protein
MSWFSFGSAKKQMSQNPSSVQNYQVYPTPQQPQPQQAKLSTGSMRIPYGFTKINLNEIMANKNLEENAIISYIPEVGHDQHIEFFNSDDSLGGAHRFHNGKVTIDYNRVEIYVPKEFSIVKYGGKYNRKQTRKSRKTRK